METLASLVAPDADYVVAFQALADVNLDLRKSGATVPLLLRRSALLHAIGDHRSSIEDATRASLMSPLDHEAHFRLGAACLAEAARRAGLVPAGHGCFRRCTPRGEGGARPLLEAARDAFCRACMLRPDDEEATHALRAVEAMLRAMHRQGGGRGPE